MVLLRRGPAQLEPEVDVGCPSIGSAHMGQQRLAIFESRKTLLLDRVRMAPIIQCQTTPDCWPGDTGSVAVGDKFVVGFSFLHEEDS